MNKEWITIFFHIVIVESKIIPLDTKISVLREFRYEPGVGPHHFTQRTHSGTFYKHFPFEEYCCHYTSAYVHPFVTSFFS